MTLLAALVIIGAGIIRGEDPDPELLKYIDKECPIPEYEPGDCIVWILVWNEQIQQYVLPAQPTIFSGRAPTTLVWPPYPD